jgi:hypothetical protein
MLAAAAGEKDAVTMLLDANAVVDAANADGRQALDVTSNTDIRLLLQEHVDRSVVSKRISRACSLPSITKPPMKPQAVCRSGNDTSLLSFRLRVDGLRQRSSEDEAEKEVNDLISRHRVARPDNVEVVVDPITMLSRGHAFLSYASREQVERAEARLSESLNGSMRVSIDGSFA